MIAFQPLFYDIVLEMDGHVKREEKVVMWSKKKVCMQVFAVVMKNVSKASSFLLISFCDSCSSVLLTYFNLPNIPWFNAPGAKYLLIST